MQFFMVDKLPFEIYDYVKCNNPDLSEHSGLFFDELKLLCSGDHTDRILFESAKHGYLNLIKYLYLKGFQSFERKKVYSYKYKYRYTYSYNCRPRQLVGEKMMQYAIVNCQNDVFRYLYKLGIKMNTDYCTNNLKNIALADNIECLKFLSEKQEVNYTNLSHICASHGAIKCLKYAYSLVKDKGMRLLALQDKIAFHAAINDKLNCLKFAVENKFEFDIECTKDKCKHEQIKQYLNDVFPTS